MESKLVRLKQAMRSNEAAFELRLSEETLTQLGEYYSLLTRWNERLHLVAPCSPEEFAVRHMLESLMLLKHLPRNAHVADIGSGGGLPIIPCLIARPDLHATLIDSSQRKSVFLREALNAIDRSNSAVLISKPFEATTIPPTSYVTCRALDRFTDKALALFDWAPERSTLLLLGGETLREQLVLYGATFMELLIPLSLKRFLFVFTKALPAKSHRL